MSYVVDVAYDPRCERKISFCSKSTCTRLSLREINVGHEKSEECEER